jgi:transcriptional regulator with XRE-family HTH domain
MALSIAKLRKVINDELDRRKLSMRELATIVGISHSTLSRIMDETRTDYSPDTETFVKIAYGINLKASTLMAIVTDESEAERDESLLIADQINSLPDSSRQVINQIIVGFHNGNSNT